MDFWVSKDAELYVKNKTYLSDKMHLKKDIPG
jgi:hypothetical protein